jgi:maltooligosyltrehalose trehalohydrolase
MFPSTSEVNAAASGTNRPTPLERRLGATRAPDGHCDFMVWAPGVSRMEVRLFDDSERVVELASQPHGYHQGAVDYVAPNLRYTYRLDGNKERADPASRFQPDGVHGPSQVLDTSDFEWDDREWEGLELQDYIFYELHTGTYTTEGTFDAIIPRLAVLKSLGVSALELMPVAQFPGGRNWGYDGVFPFAVQNTYGGPGGLKRLVNACHCEGLAVVLDVVYNHLGPEGNYLSDFGPYFTDRYRTPWGEAINFDGPHSDHVVRFFIENAIHWLDDFHIDALRLDAVHGIVDRNARPFLALLSAAVDDFAHRNGRRVYLIAESDLNDFRFVTPRTAGGYGLHAQWNDDFHHALHSLQTEEQCGYYADFGSLEHLRKALHGGFVFTGEYSVFRQRRQGSSSSAIKASQLVVFSQNHDQAGNRLFGERSAALLSLEQLKLSAGVLVLSPYLPLLFMGEEYGETAPFLYFTSHHDPALAEDVRAGRRAEFSAFCGNGDPPDPQAESSFLQSRLDHGLREGGRHRVLWNFYRELIRFRKASPGLRQPEKATCEVGICGSEKCLFMRRWWEREEVFALFNFGDRSANLCDQVPAGEWRKQLDSADTKWLGPGTTVSPVVARGKSFDLELQPRSLCLFGRIQRL